METKIKYLGNSHPDVNAILERLKTVTGIKTDSKLAELFEVNRSTLANWRDRQSLDYVKLFSLCESLSLDLNYIVLNKLPVYNPYVTEQTLNIIKDAANIILAATGKLEERSKESYNEPDHIKGILFEKEKLSQVLTELQQKAG